MSITRRTLLAAGTAALTLPALARRAAARDMPVLRAAPSTAQIAPAGYGPSPVWSYGGTVPGPEIRVRAGERVRRRFENGLPQDSAVHWHGIRIANAMDGAAGVTQDPVPPGGTFDYDFVAPDPGTYWYHAHARSWEQVARGLAGPLIVDDVEAWEGLEGAATAEATLMLADWRLQEDGALHEASFGDLHDWAHAGRLGNTVTINGAIDARLPVRRGERLRLRLINAATARIMPLRMPGLAPLLIALDGYPVAPRPAERILLAPAQRADIVVDIPAGLDAPLPILMDAGRDEWVEIGSLIDGGVTALPPQAGPVRPLPAGTARAPDLSAPQEEVLRMEGGAMGRLERARLGGVEQDFRQLVAARRVWAFNGVAGDMDEPAFRAPLGRTVRLRLVNETRWPHGIHLHGHHFTVLTRGEQPDAYQARRDTVLVRPGEPVEIAFVADNPGRWLLHCHMLGHQASGMLSWFEVT
ncbi:multicopper oxidase family protein [Jannaschia aquimarina]|uniref:Mco protein n=1 Tax=Jannaschia aquimarina TaxID=935700 RepID=A0A0D1EN48_9RHOB|nr:multicopper oxidase family protein [Jannaschia aquimarina]KIT17125.1 Multicopper oxidase mco [Jannaschia aquimarina]SNS47399.1 Multicopper oxidase with three cupredoxin domains (includes cell division protein FtsP and spore coat protein CotA) [Jannaschia aquimarina]